MRFETPAAYITRRINDAIVTCVVGPHCVDTEWEWWRPWEPLSDPLARTLDGAHPSLTWTPIEPQAAAEPR